MNWLPNTRQPQRGCKPPTIANKTPKYQIPAGTRVLVRRIDDAKWKPFVTTKPNSFNESEGKSKKVLLFRVDGWQMKVWANQIR